MSATQDPTRRPRPVAAWLTGALTLLGALVLGAVTVFAAAPTADFGWLPAAPEVGQSVTFSGTGSDPDNDEITTWEWDFDEGGGFVAGTQVQAHAFTSSGTKDVRLRASDVNGEPSEIVTKQVTVTDPPPPPPTPPTNVTAPTVSGTAVDGGTLSATNGVWNGTQPITFTRQWQSCQGFTCTDISGATGTTYSPVPADVGKTIRVVVTADNDAPGTVSEPSAATGAVEANPPQNTVPPDIDGSAVVGENLALSNGNGSWSGTPPIAFARQWLRCNAAGAACAPIAGATGFGYALKAADLGSTIRVLVTADNPAAGVATALSAAVGPIEAPPPGPPVNTSPPVIVGSAVEGQRLFVGSNGSWDGTIPLTYTYQWQRCSPACADIPGATAGAYDLVPADVATTIRVRVTATNAVGTATANSSATVAVARRPPVNLGPPTISGPASVGGRLTASNGIWTGTEPIAYTRKWLRCNAAGGACAPIPGQAATSYVVTQADFGRTIRVEVTADNASAGNVQATSAPTAAIVQNLPPIAAFRSSPTAPLAGDTVDFTSLGYDPDGPITAYAWDLDGDGQYADASDRVASKTFTKAGQYTVGLRVTDTDGATDVERTVVNVASRPSQPLIQLSRPFLRLKYSSSRRWTRIKIFTVRVSRGATVKTRCRGRGCPKSGSSNIRSKGRTIRLRRLERRFRVGTRLAVVVTYPDRIGRYTRLRIRARARIARRDLCLMPRKTKPIACRPE
jgi:PKD repeat protein